MKKIIYLILFFNILSFVAYSQDSTQQNDEKIEAPSNQNQFQSLPLFIGGPSAYEKFLSNNIHYPEKAIKDKIEGRAVVGLVVEKDGSLSNFKLQRDPGAGLGEEAIRVLKLSPKWSTGKKNNRTVRTQIWVFVNFTLPN